MKSPKQLFFALFLFLFCTQAHTGLCQHTFIRRAAYAMGYYSSIQSISTFDGGVLMAAPAEAPVNSIHIGIKLIKYDAHGEIQWERYLFNMQGDFGSYSLAQSNNSYVIGGLFLNELDFNRQFIIRMNLSGDVIWSKTFFPNDAAIANSYNINIFKNGDILFNNISLASGSSGPELVTVGRVDTNGNISWVKYYQETFMYGYGMMTSDENIVTQHYDVITMSDASGKVLWTKTISGLKEGTKPIEINSKKLLLPIYQSSTNSFSLLALSDKGNILWNTEMFPGYPSKILNTKDGNVLILSSGLNFYLFDQSGHLLKTNRLTFTDALDRYTSSISELCENNFLGFGSQGSTLFTYKINSDLQSKCGDTSVIKTSPPLTHAISSYTTTDQPANDYTSDYLFLLSTTDGTAFETICENFSCEKIDLGDDTVVCGSNRLTLEANLKPLLCASKRNYKWSTGDTTSSIDVNKNGKYWLEVDEDNCQSADTITVLFDLQSLDLGDDINLCPEKNESKELSSFGFIHYQWSTGDTTSSIIVSKPGVYSVSARSAFGCDYMDSIIVYDVCPPELYMPEAFSPNGDGKNDVFQPNGKYIHEYKLRIYNRWGKMVFESSDPMQGWNGKYKGDVLPEGSYVWIIDYMGSYQNEPIRKSMKGTVALLR